LHTDAKHFLLNICVNRDRTGIWSSLGFSLVQRSRDTLLFECIKEFLGYISVRIAKSGDIVRFRVDKFSTIS